MSDKYTDEYIARIQEVQDYIDQNYGKNMTGEELADGKLGVMELEGA